MKWEIRRDSKGGFYARIIAGNGEVVCWTESYTSKQNALNAVAWIKANAPLAPVADLT